MQEHYKNTGFIKLCFSNLLPLLAMNVLFLLLCVPVVTIPAAVTALHCGCQNLLLDEKQVIRRFWRSFRSNLFSSIPFGILFVLGPVGVLYGSIFYYQLSEGTGIFVALSCFCLIGIYLLFTVGAFAFAMQARFDLKTKDILKNAVHLTFRYPRTLFSWLFLAFAVLVGMVCLLPYSLAWFVLLGVSLPCFASERGVLPIVDSLIVKE